MREPPCTGSRWRRGGGPAAGANRWRAPRAAIPTRGAARLVGQPGSPEATLRTPLAGHYGPAALGRRGRVPVLHRDGAAAPRRGVGTVVEPGIGDGRREE